MYLMKKLRNNFDGWFILIFSIILFILPFLIILLQRIFIIWLVMLTLFYIILALTWNLLLGYARLLSFAHTGLLGIGAYSSALLVSNNNLPPLIGLIIGSSIAGMAGLILGYICLRLKGIYLALATWGFSGSVQLFVITQYNITGGLKGMFTAFLLPVSPFENPYYYYYIEVLLVLLCLLVMYKIIHSKYGLYLKAMGDDEIAASACGVNVFRLKLFLFVITSFFVGLAGAFYVHLFGYVSPSIADFFTIMLTVISGTILGGLGTFAGPVLGVIIIWPIYQVIGFYGAEYQLFILAILLIILLRFFKGGFIGIVYSMYRKYTNKYKQ